MKVTIADIARMADVSKATVSRVINNHPEGVSNETRNRILDLIESVGYQPNMMARSLVTSRSKEIALIIPDITNPFFTVLVRGVQDFAESKQYSVFIFNTDDDVSKEQQYLLSGIKKRVDGIILISNTDKHENLGNINPTLRPPLVLLDRRTSNLEYDISIQSDNVSGGYKATKHLLEQGRRHIAYLAGPEHVEVTSDRLIGYRKALQDFNVPFRPGLVLHGHYNLASGQGMAKKLIESGVRFDALFCGCDLIAMSAIQVCHEAGYTVPGDLLVVGFDNISMSELFEPSLTTVDQRPYLMGKRAIESLIAILEGNLVSKKRILLESKLIIRNSSKGVVNHE